MASTKQERFGIAEAARRLDRSPQTLRSWDRKNLMPKRLRPKRDRFGNRYWTPALIDEIKEWMARSNFHPGRGIAYHPDADQLQRHIDKMRAANRRRSGRGARRNGIGSNGAVSDEFRHLVSDALSDGQAPQDVLARLPEVAEQYGIPLDEALLVTSAVIAESATSQ